MVWLHKGAEVNAGRGGKYALTETTVTTAQTYRVASTLVIGEVEAGDSGDVTCVAVVEGADTKQVVTGSADLIVLCKGPEKFNLTALANCL